MEGGYLTLDGKEAARKDWTRLRMQELLWTMVFLPFYNCLWTKKKENPVGIFKKIQSRTTEREFSGLKRSSKLRKEIIVWVVKENRERRFWTRNETGRKRKRNMTNIYRVAQHGIIDASLTNKKRKKGINLLK